MDEYRGKNPFNIRCVVDLNSTNAVVDVYIHSSRFEASTDDNDRTKYPDNQVCPRFLSRQFLSRQPSGHLYMQLQHVILLYYTALLIAVERSVHMRGLSRLRVMNYFSIMTVAMYIITAVKESHVFCINPCVTYPPQRTRLLSDVNVFGGLFLC